MSDAGESLRSELRPVSETTCPTCSSLLKGLCELPHMSDFNPPAPIFALRVQLDKVVIDAVAAKGKGDVTKLGYGSGL